ncbi:MAG: SDR family NAD(P)-dependent oxidoreductase [Acidimicrobiia bacterium]|nr:SDR family NAD(P)-dependent oxidoreductase [Acidimicrobiia bacterium]MDH5236512.1 SDR family NAD(P)-dependent oxidoreductase [Acidimicrobiia bacterium]
MTETTFITGASSGIGRHLATELAARGHDVVVTARRVDRLDALAADIGRRHPARQVWVRQLDVNDAEAVLDAVRWADQATGGLTRVVANAGLGSQAEGRLGQPEHGVRSAALVATNVTGLIATIDAGIDVLAPRGRGHLVAISSVAATRGLPWSATYSATKAAVDTYMEAVTAWLVDTDIDTTVIKPGYIQTEIFDDGAELPDVTPVEDAIGPLTDAIIERRAEAVVPANPYLRTIELLRGLPVHDLKKLTPPSRA